MCFRSQPFLGQARARELMRWCHLRLQTTGHLPGESTGVCPAREVCASGPGGSLLGSGTPRNVRQKPHGLCGHLCSDQEGGRLSGAENGAASEALWLSPVPETAGLCIPHPHPCSLPSAESRNQGGSHQNLRQKPLGPGGPLCSHQEGGRLSGAEDGAAKMAPPQKLCGSRLPQKLLASVFHTLTRAACPPRSPGAKGAPAAGA